jgi:RNA-directed DNA polymerase
MPKTLKHCFDTIIAPDNLYLAYRKARAGKGDRPSVAAFEFNLEQELYDLRIELGEGRYVHGAYRQRTIYERKPRLISIAPFRDRVVHHALMGVVEPILDKSMIEDSYACRHGKGVHCAVDRYQHYAARHPYVLQLDIQQYFASVDHEVLMRQLHRRISDTRVLDLFKQIVGSYSSAPTKGLPIGNLTSQFLANFYLNGFDHWVKEQQRVPGYLRYVDDFFLFAKSKQAAWQYVAAVQNYLRSLGLMLHPNKIHLHRTSERVDVLGYLVTPGRRWLRNDNGHRFNRRFKQLVTKYRKNELTLSKMHQHVRSWIGHAQHGETLGLRRALLGARQLNG